MIYGKVLEDSIKREKMGMVYSEVDKFVLSEMLDDINACFGTSFHYLAEIDLLHVKGSGQIMAKYLNEFQGEGIKAFIIPHLVMDKIDGCASIVLQTYFNFRHSDEYNSVQGESNPAFIFVRYDNAFRKLKPKKFKNDLLSLACCPKDAFYLPFTMRMLASWKIPELERVFLQYLDGESISYETVGIPFQPEKYYSRLCFMRRELKFTAIECLKYYPSDRIIEIMKEYSNDSDKDIALAANKTLRYIENH